MIDTIQERRAHDHASLKHHAVYNMSYNAPIKQHHKDIHHGLE